MKKTFFYIVLITLCLVVTINSCEYEYIIPEELSPVDTTKIISFDTIVVRIFFDQNCINCHNNGGQSPNLSANSPHASIVPALVNIGDPELSTIYTKPHPDGNHSQKYTINQAQNVLQWITQGALNN